VDLFHRLSTVTITLPPLRRRKSDLPALCQVLLARLAADVGEKRVSGPALARLVAHGWPGNVRELEHVISRASLRAFREQRRGARWTAIEPHHLALEAAAAGGPAASPAPPAPAPAGQHAGVASGGATLREATEAFQRAWLADALARHRGHVANAAREAGIDRSNFHRTLRKLGVPRPESTP